MIRKSGFLLSFFFLLLASAAAAQTSALNDNNSFRKVEFGCVVDGRFISGMTLTLNLRQGMRSSRARPGDRVTARTIGERCLGTSIVPDDSRVTGHITEVEKATHSRHEWRLGIVFDTVHLAGNREIRFNGTLQDLQIVKEATQYESEGCEVSVSLSDPGNPAGSETCGGRAFYTTYSASDPRLWVVETRSVISSSSGKINLHVGDTLTVKITGVK